MLARTPKATEMDFVSVLNQRLEDSTEAGSDRRGRRELARGSSRA